MSLSIRLFGGCGPAIGLNANEAKLHKTEHLSLNWSIVDVSVLTQNIVEVHSSSIDLGEDTDHAEPTFQNASVIV